MDDDFYLRYYIGHDGRFGHEFMEFEVYSDGRMRYANNSNYKQDMLIRKEVTLQGIVLEELQKIIRDSTVLREDDKRWPEPDDIGRQELEIRLDSEHVSFTCAKLGALSDCHVSQDPVGVQIFYYLVQDLKSFVFSLISLHFKIKPIP